MIRTQTMPTTPIRQIQAKVELYNDSTLQETFYYNDYLKSIEVNRAGAEGKFIGLTIGQKVKVVIIDKDNQFTVVEGMRLVVYFNHGEGYISPFPSFYINAVSRDKVTNEVTLEAADLFQEAEKHTVAEAQMRQYTLWEFIAYCNGVLTGDTTVSVNNIEISDKLLQLSYEQGANFSGKETLRDALEYAAEALQCNIYFNRNNTLTIKRYEQEFIDYTFTPSEYFSFEKNENAKTISKVAHISELGENLESKDNGQGGITHYVRENPFYNTLDRVKLAEVLDYAADLQVGKSYNIYTLEARGNYLLELGDYISIRDKSGVESGACFVNDTIKYSGGLSQKLFVSYEEKAKTKSTNPTTLGDKLNETTALVDKVNRRIVLLASEEDISKSKIASLELTTEGISARVESAEQATDSANTAIGELAKKVAATMSAEDVRIEIQSAMDDGVAKVETATGYTFNESGLTVSKTGSEMTTTITEDGMAVYKNNNEVLRADNEGVKAIDLHATTYLVIGKNSRLEDYGNRTACFWIGG